MPNTTEGRRIISVSLPDRLHEQLTQICKDDDLPVSIFVRHLINRAVKERTEG
jgi:metal-responsive CopG/Arc/MetJ family transcriptional regulator